MEIQTKSGKTLNVGWVLETDTRQGSQQLIIQFSGETEPRDVFNHMVGLDIMEVKENENSKHVYTGYTRFHALTYTYDRNALRLTLEKP